MAWLLGNPDLASWGAEEDGDEEEDDIEDCVEEYEALNEPPPEIALHREEDSED